MKDFFVELFNMVALNGSNIEEWLVQKLTERKIDISEFDINNYRDDINLISKKEWLEIFDKAIRNNHLADLDFDIPFNIDINELLNHFELTPQLFQIFKYIDKKVITNDTFLKIVNNKEILANILINYDKSDTAFVSLFENYALEYVKEKGSINSLKDILSEENVEYYRFYIADKLKADISNFAKIDDLLLYTSKETDSRPAILYLIKNGKIEDIKRKIEDIKKNNILSEEEINELINFEKEDFRVITTNLGIEYAKSMYGGMTIELFERLESHNRKKYLHDFLTFNKDNSKIFEILSLEEIQELLKSQSSHEIFESLTSEVFETISPSTLKSFTKNDIISFIKNGFSFDESTIKLLSNSIGESDEIFRLLCDNNPKMIFEYLGNNQDLIKEYLDKIENLPSPQQISIKNKLLVGLLLDISPDYIESLDIKTEINLSDDLVKKYISKKGDSVDALIKVPKLYVDLDRLKSLIDIDENYIFFAPNISPQINLENFKYALDKGFSLDYSTYSKLPSHLLEMEEIFNMALKKDKKNILAYEGEKIEFLYLKSKMKLELEKFLKENKNKEDFQFDLHYDAILNSEEYKKFCENIVTIYNSSYYKFDSSFLVNNYKYVEYALTALEFDIKDYLSSNINSNVDIIKHLVNLCKTNEIRDFKLLLNKFSKDLNNNMDSYKELNLLLSNYERYPNICNIIMNEELTKEEIDKVRYLFLRKGTINEKKIKTISDLKDVDQMIIDNHKVKFNNARNIKERKEILCELFFDSSYEEMINKINIYGTVEDFELLRKDNKKNLALNNSIDDAITLVSIIEGIRDIQDEEILKGFFKKCISNIELVNRFNKIFSKFDEFMRDFYEREIQANLFDVENSILSNDIKKTDLKTGIVTYDLSNTDYIMLAHVCSSNEKNIDDIIEGKYSSEMMTMCLSAVGYLGQEYYGDPSDENNIVLGYTNIPNGNFCMSSRRNMSSNNSLTYGSMEIRDIKDREQRGIREITRTQGRNNEYLFYRDGLKPTSIILKDGREPTEYEIELAKKHNLFFVKTQTPSKKMESTPEKITKKEETVFGEVISEKSILKEIRQELLSKKDERKIMIFTDSHGLYEPTLALLENARKQGITEIYSLGDNIGTGPNPSETMDLLERYGVQSIKGNHELYLLEGPDKYLEHLNNTGSYKEQKEDSEWLRGRLREDQIEKIAKMPSQREIIVGGKKILLCHSLDDYNKGERLYNPIEYDRVFQGHTHFFNENENVTTVRAAGMGNSAQEDLQKAFCLVITEKKDGYEVESITVDYNYELAKESLLYENPPQAEKLNEWISNVHR